MNDVDKKEDTGHAITFAEAEARSPRIRSLGDEVRKALVNPVVWQGCESYLYGTAQTGSTQFNHANVVTQIRDWDRKANHSRIAHYGLTDIALWRVVHRVLKAHFDVSRGVIVGLLEYQKEDAA